MVEHKADRKNIRAKLITNLPANKLEELKAIAILEQLPALVYQRIELFVSRLMQSRGISRYSAKTLT